MVTKAYSVRLKSLVSISDKAFKAVSFDGSTDILPKSVVFGPDFGVIKSNAYWIAAWILQKKDIQYSSKKEAFFNEKGVMVPSVTVETYIPDIMTPKTNNEIQELKK